jgi:hypothetical protein
MGFRPPRCNDPSFVIVSLGINHRDFHATHQPDGIHADFTIVKTIIDPFHGWPLENPQGIFKGNMVPPQIVSVLFVRPSIAHGVY